MLNIISPADTIVIMVSVGNRTSITDYTFPALSNWAARNGYSVALVKKPVADTNRLPHFNKLLVHQLFKDFKKYIIVDDDLLMRKDAPAVPAVPFGFVGLCADAEQQNTEAPHVLWTANTGFMVANQEALYLLEEAYQSGDYPHHPSDGSGLGIWPAIGDQPVLNNLLFKRNKIFKLDQRWNYQPVLEFFIHGKGWKTWKNNRLYRLSYYVYLLSPIKNKHKLAVKQAYGIHLIRGVYPWFYTKFLF